MNVEVNVEVGVQWFVELEDVQSTHTQTLLKVFEATDCLDFLSLQQKSADFF